MRRRLFYSELRDFLREFHPLLVSDQDYIENRVEQARQALQSCMNAGMSYDDSLCEAQLVLYSGLHFSVYKLISDIVEEQYKGHSFLPSEKFLKKLLQVMQPIISHYQIDDDFDRTSAYNELYNELSEAIGRYIKETQLS